MSILSNIWRPKKKRFVLFCHQRSGSNLLAGLINQHPDVRLFGQLFKENQSHQKKLLDLGVIPFTGKLFDDDIGGRNRFDELELNPKDRVIANTSEFLESLFKNGYKITKSKWFGVKIHGGTIFRNEIKDLIIDKNYKVIILHRKKLLKAAVSWYYARELNQWSKRKGVDADLPELELDIDTLAWFIERTKHDINLWKSLLNEKNHEFLELTYEELVKDFNLSKVWDFLGVKGLEGIDPQHEKLLKKYDMILNREEINKKLGSPENGYL